MVVGIGGLLILRSFTTPQRTVSLDLAPVRRRLPELGSGIAGFAVTYLVTGSLFISICLGIMAGTIPGLWREAVARRRREALRAAWPEVLDEVVSGVRAGLGVGEALAQVSVRGPAAVRPQLLEFALHLRAVGRLDPCLDELKDNLADPMADRIIESVRLAHDLGGRDLAGMLHTLASLVREDNRTRGELLARQSWTVNGARIAAVAPWLVLLLLVTRPGTIESYSTPAGAAVLIGGLVATIVAYALMVRLGKLPEESRILAGVAP